MSSEMAHYPPDWSATNNDQSHSDSQQSENTASTTKQEELQQLRPGNSLKRKRSAYASEVDTEDDERVNGIVHATKNEGRRPVRARSLIDDDQLAVLKSYYAINPKPKKEEIVMIANYINFPTRVVQVDRKNFQFPRQSCAFFSAMSF